MTKTKTRRGRSTKGTWAKTPAGSALTDRQLDAASGGISIAKPQDCSSPDATR